MIICQSENPQTFFEGAKNRSLEVGIIHRLRGQFLGTFDLPLFWSLLVNSQNAGLRPAMLAIAVLVRRGW